MTGASPTLPGTSPGISSVRADVPKLPLIVLTREQNQKLRALLQTLDWHVSCCTTSTTTQSGAALDLSTDREKDGSLRRDEAAGAFLAASSWSPSAWTNRLSATPSDWEPRNFSLCEIPALQFEEGPDAARLRAIITALWGNDPTDPEKQRSALVGGGLQRLDVDTVRQNPQDVLVLITSPECARRFSFILEAVKALPKIVVVGKGTVDALLPAHRRGVVFEPSIASAEGLVSELPDELLEEATSIFVLGSNLSKCHELLADEVDVRRGRRGLLHEERMLTTKICKFVVYHTVPREDWSQVRDSLVWPEEGHPLLLLDRRGEDRRERDGGRVIWTLASPSAATAVRQWEEAEGFRDQFGRVRWIAAIGRTTGDACRKLWKKEEVPCPSDSGKEPVSIVEGENSVYSWVAAVIAALLAHDDHECEQG